MEEASVRHEWPRTSSNTIFVRKGRLHPCGFSQIDSRQIPKWGATVGPSEDLTALSDAPNPRPPPLSIWPLRPSALSGCLSPRRGPPRPRALDDTASASDTKDDYFACLGLRRFSHTKPACERTSKSQPPPPCVRRHGLAPTRHLTS